MASNDKQRQNAPTTGPSFDERATVALERISDDLHALRTRFAPAGPVPLIGVAIARRECPRGHGLQPGETAETCTWCPADPGAA